MKIILYELGIGQLKIAIKCDGTKELQELRVKTKPGLIPPFYADMPVTLEEIMASEIKYLRAYEKRPYYTDFSYFFKSIYNILIKKKRSS